VADRHFGELARITAEASGHLADPCARVREHALAYCEFGLAHPGQYQVMFSSALPLVRGEGGVRDQAPGRPAFDKLAEATAGCIGCQPGDGEARLTATLIWQQLHGSVSLRISRPYFPWPPLPGEVADAVSRLLAGARARVSERARAGDREQSPHRQGELA
jgi:hypothetical protein